MSRLFTVDRKQYEITPDGGCYLPVSRQGRTFGAGEALYQAGNEGLAWRVLHGIVRRHLESSW